jgi:hypothetical protein
MDKSKFQTGDILLFHHKNNFSSVIKGLFSLFTDLIMWWTRSKYSHCAIIVRDPKFMGEEKKGLYVLESSYENFEDIEDGEYKLGCELEKFDKVVGDYQKNGGSVYWRKLNCERDNKFYEDLNEAHSVLHNRPYDLDIVDWVKVAFNINKGNNQSKKRFWCSALVAYVYVKFGFLDKKTPWGLITAKMFGTEKQDNKLVFKNCSLDNEIQIV